MQMPTPTIQAWQSVLQSIIKAPAERQRLATALGVTQMTLSRWVNENSRPQRNHLIQLVQMVQPQHRTALMEALEQSYPEIRNWLHDETPGQIPTDFFSQVLSARATVIESLRFWQLSDMVLRQALAQLDPN